MNPVMTPGEAKSRELKDDERSVSTIAQANGLFNFEDEEILQTEEEALDAELQLRPLTEEEVALKATEVQAMFVTMMCLYSMRVVS